MIKIKICWKKVKKSLRILRAFALHNCAAQVQKTIVEAPALYLVCFYELGLAGLLMRVGAMK